MAKIESLEDFQTWQKARLLNTEINLLTDSSVFNSNFNLKNQIRSSALSVVANLAEGYGRKGNKEFLHFLSISFASLIETKSHLYSSIDLKLLKSIETKKAFGLISDIKNMTAELMYKLKNSSYKGPKFK